MGDSVAVSAEYRELIDSIKQTIAVGRLRAARAVNTTLVETYWKIGHEIVVRRLEQGWGAKVTDQLAADLRVAHPNIQGLSGRNLRYMATFASRWPDPIGQQPVAQLPWGHVTVLLDSFPDRETAEFYAGRAVEEGWSRAALRAMIANRLHERSQPALTTFDSSVPETDREAVRELVKDPFILDFLAADPAKERDLSNALIANISKFLRELGVGWAFLGAEVPIQCGDSEYFLDLLFYHCRLYRYVVLELKLGRFHPSHVGQLNFYVQLVDDKLRNHTKDDPTLGILLMVDRDDVTVEVALRGITTPLAVTEWRRLPSEVRRALPTTQALTETVTRTVREIESAVLQLWLAELGWQIGRRAVPRRWATLAVSSAT